LLNTVSQEGDVIARLFGAAREKKRPLDPGYETRDTLCCRRKLTAYFSGDRQCLIT